jgi:hypothetical protein
VTLFLIIAGSCIVFNTWFTLQYLMLFEPEFKIVAFPTACTCGWLLAIYIVQHYY